MSWAGSQTAQTSRNHWRNTTYTLICEGISTQPVVVTLRNGEGRAPGNRSWRWGYRVFVLAVTSGDLTGDGRAELSVLLGCQSWGANYSIAEVQVFTPARRRLARLPHLRPIQPGGGLQPEFVTRDFRVRNGMLLTGVGYYASGDCHACGPSLYTLLAWQWNGRGFTTRLPVGAPGNPQRTRW